MAMKICRGKQIDYLDGKFSGLYSPSFKGADAKQIKTTWSCENRARDISPIVSSSVRHQFLKEFGLAPNIAEPVSHPHSTAV